MLTKTVALEVADKGIRVNEIAPGAIATDMNIEILEDEQKRKEEEMRILMHRIGRPQEIAKVTLFLASVDASFMTGTRVYVDSIAGSGDISVDKVAGPAFNGEVAGSGDHAASGKLEDDHVPAPAALGGARPADDCAGVGDSERDCAFDALRRGDGGVVRDQSTPVVANEVHRPPGRPLVDQRDHVAGQGCEIERTRGRRRGVTAKPGREDVSTLAAELVEERLRRWRVVRESVQEDRRLTCGVTALQSVKSAMRQVESDVFEVHMCCACFEVGRTRDAGAGFGVSRPVG